jgi:hypothetical protein
MEYQLKKVQRGRKKEKYCVIGVMSLVHVLCVRHRACINCTRVIHLFESLDLGVEVKKSTFCCLIYRYPYTVQCVYCKVYKADSLKKKKM